MKNAVRAQEHTNNNEKRRRKNQLRVLFIAESEVVAEAGERRAENEIKIKIICVSLLFTSKPRTAEESGGS